MKKKSNNKLFAGFLIACGILVCGVIALSPRWLTLLSPLIGVAIVVTTLVWLDRRKLL